MKIVSSLRDIKRILTPLRGKKKIGFVPTMGAFHEGHLSLMRAAKRECDYSIVSIFVNPLQFGPTEDFDRYPHDVRGDRKKAEAEGIDLLWRPRREEITPSDMGTSVIVKKLSADWEGKARPGHFRGVATIVTKLFQIVRPDVVYLGQKDYQQAVIIQQLARDLHFDLRIRVLPTIREYDGLACSSRNRFLTPEDRRAATVLYRALCRVKQSVQAGERNCALLRKTIELIFVKEPRVKADYIAFCHPKTLAPVSIIDETVLLLAVGLGSVRLIDNIKLRKK